MKILITNNISQEFSSDEILDVCKKSTGEVGDILVDENRTYGHYIILEDPKSKIYILLSSKSNLGRNAYLAQFFSTAYSDFVLDKTSKKKSFEIFLFDNPSIDANYNKFVYKLLKTCNIRIINEIDLLHTVYNKFSSHKEIQEFRRDVSMRNSSNNSTYFSEEGDHISVFGKVFGANGKESALICFALVYISSKPIWLYQVYDNESNQISSKDLQALELLGIQIKEKIPEMDNGNIKLDIKEKDLRDTPKFHYNLLKKYDIKKCYLCSCDIGGMIVGAHIHRVTDIKNDKTIATETKISQIVDGDNGFWFCSDHDKLFELGLIYFIDKNLVISNRLNEKQNKFVDNITEKFEIEPVYFNENMSKYINLHLKRTRARVSPVI